MAGSDGATTHSIAENLPDLALQPHAYGFYQALRLLESRYKERPRLGRSRKPVDDSVRLSQEASLAFESATLTRFRPGDAGVPHRLWVRWLGLLGPNGPLPLHMTEYIQECQRDFKDDTLAAFLDLFHHRALSFFYRAWADGDPCVNYDRPDEDRFTTYLASLFGLGMSALRHRDGLSDHTKFYYGGRLALQTRNPEGLAAILNDYFELPVEIEEFVGEWIPLSPAQQSRLGLGSCNTLLGRDTILGQRVWGAQHKFRLRLGPMDLDAYQRLLPTGDRIRRLISLVRNYMGDELSWDVNLLLDPQAVPPTRLDGNTRLGWTAWLAASSETDAACDLTLDPMRLAELN